MNKLITVVSQCIEEIERSDYVSLLCDETTDVYGGLNGTKSHVLILSPQYHRVR